MTNFIHSKVEAHLYKSLKYKTKIQKNDRKKNINKLYYEVGTKTKIKMTRSMVSGFKNDNWGKSYIEWMSENYFFLIFKNKYKRNY